MFSKINSAVIYGIDSIIVRVEADVSDGLPCFDMVGDLAPAVKEAKERVRTGLKNSGFSLRARQLVLNFAPANIRKDGSLMDLAIALSILGGYEIIDASKCMDMVVVGELGLDGNVNAVPGVIPILISAKEAGYKRVMIPAGNYRETIGIDGIKVIGVSNLKEAVEYVANGTLGEKTFADMAAGEAENVTENLDFADIVGQEGLKRACEIGAAGLHNILIIGPQGSGKTMVARRLPGILPGLREEEVLEVSKIYSVYGEGLSKGLITARPFRAPHHMVTPAALVGGGSRAKLGEVSLAHKGVLFLDEFTEFNKSTLDTLRQPLEDKKVHISRLHGSFVYPADFMLVAAMNPCKCGYYPNMNKCTCSYAEINRYLGKISGPLLDRIDICVEAPRVEYKDITSQSKGESSETIRKRVIEAHRLQELRYKGTEYSYNSDLNATGIKKYCRLNKECSEFMETVFEKMNLSARGYHRILKTARTIGDLAGSEDIKIEHLTEAVYYKLPDSTYWIRRG